MTGRENKLHIYMELGMKEEHKNESIKFNILLKSR